MSTPQPDFLQPVRAPHPLARVACAAALLVLAVAAMEAWQAHAALAQAQARVQAQASQRGPAQPRPAPPADTPEKRAVRQALAQLQRPWSQVVAAVENVQVPGVAWLALDIGEKGALRLEGAAPDAASALAAAAALRADPLWREVLVARIDAAPAGGWRFALVATPVEGAW